MNTFSKMAAFTGLLATAIPGCAKYQTISGDEYLRAIDGAPVRGEKVAPDDHVTLVLRSGEELRGQRHGSYCTNGETKVTFDDCSARGEAKRVALVKNVSVVEVKKPNVVGTVVLVSAITLLAGASIAVAAVVQHDFSRGWGWR